jgi:hypothetical protein
MRSVHRTAAFGLDFTPIGRFRVVTGQAQVGPFYRVAAFGLDITPIGDAETSRDRLR